MVSRFSVALLHSTLLRFYCLEFITAGAADNDDRLFSGMRQIPGRIVTVELTNFMCHKKLKVDFNVTDNNCFLIGGSNGCKVMLQLL